MSDKQKPGIGYTVSLCGIMCGLALAMMFVLGMIPGFEYISPATAGVFIWVIRESLGVKYGMVSYLAVAILCFLITPNYEASMMFLMLLGYYPILREYFQKIPFALFRYIVKLALYTAAACAVYFLLIYLFGMTDLLEDIGEFGKYSSLFLLGFGGVAFIVYDAFLALFAPCYEKLIKPKIRKRMR